MPTLPTVDFIIPTLNSGHILTECLDSLQALDYPKNKIHAILIDGGSTDKTRAIAKKYAFAAFHVIQTDGPEEATALGYNMSQAKYVVNYPSDNVITDPMWLRKMILPLEEDPGIDACETLRYEYVSSDKPLNKYFALYGMNDPIALYLGKKDRQGYDETTWHLQTTAEKKKTYYRTTFTPACFPTVGANGFVVRRKVIQKVTKNPKQFSHIDSCVDLMRLGHATYAFVETTIWHKTGEELGNFFSKRRKYAYNLYFKKRSMRRYHLFDSSRDTGRLLFFILYSVTFIEPLIRAIRGYRKIHDTAWFLHPVICFATTLNYVYTLILFGTFLWKKTILGKTA